MKELQAYLIYKNELHIASLPELTPYSPWTPTTILIYGIYEKYKDFSYYPLRQKISVNYPATELCYGIAKVAAKSIKTLPHFTAPQELLFPHLKTFFYSPTEKNFHFLNEKTREIHDSIFALEETVPRIHRPDWNTNDWMRFTLDILGMDPPQNENPLYEKNRRISATLVDSEGQLLEWAINTNRCNKVQHAEWNVILQHWRRTNSPLPPGSRIYSSTKPCKMCAGLIWNCSIPGNLPQIYYHHFDNGPKAKFTILNEGSHEQRRILEPPFFQNMEWQIQDLY